MKQRQPHLRLIMLILFVTVLMLSAMALARGDISPDAALAQEAPATFEPVGHFGGWLGALATVGGNYLYMGRGSGLDVFDVSDPAQPQSVGGLPLSGWDVGDLVLAGTNAYAVNGKGLRVIDITHPETPTLLGEFDLPAFAGALDVVGSYAYVLTGSGYPDYDGQMHILDVSDPTSPNEVGVYDNLSYVRGIQVVGGVAYVADGTSGLRILNVSNPANPTLLGSYDTPGDAWSAQVVDGVAYVADGASGLQILNVSDPANPTWLGLYDTPGYASQVQVQGTITYVADGGQGLLILDVSDPTRPTLLGSKSDVAAEVLTLSGGHAYVGSGGSLYVVDVSNPASPTALGDSSWPAETKDIFIPAAGASAAALGQHGGPYGYVVDETSLWIVDLSNPALPAPMGRASLAHGSLESLFVAGGRAYVVEGTDGMEIFDVTDPGSPQSLGLYPKPAYASWIADVFVSGQYAYVVGARRIAPPWGWLSIVDISDPTHPSEVAAFDTPGRAQRVFVSNGMAYVAADDAGLRLIDVSNPAAPVEVGSLDPPQGAKSEAIYLEGNEAYLGSNGDSGAWVQKINVSDPARPVPGSVFQAPAPARVRDIEVNGDQVFVAVQGASLWALGRAGMMLTAQHHSGSYETVTVTAGPPSERWIYTTGFSEGTEVFKFKPWRPRPTPTATPECSVSGIVMPPKARSSCWVKPAAKACECGVEQVVFIAPPLCGDWAFDHWAPGRVLQCPAEGNAINQGWFDPLPTVRLSSQREKYFLQGISLQNCYTAIVEWNGPPGYVDFWMNDRYERVSAAPYRVCYDMGRDFRASNYGGRNILRAIAVNGKGRQSHPAILHPLVFPFPAWVMPDMFGIWGLIPLARYVIYHSEMRFPSPEYEATVSLPSWLPLVGGDWGIKKTQIRGRFKAKSDGSGSSKLYGQTGFYVGSSSKEGRKREVVGFLSGQEKTKIRPGKGLQVEQATFTIGLKGAIKDKIGPADLFPALKAAEGWWFGLGWFVRKFNSLVKFETAFEPQVYATLFWKSIKDELEFNHGEFIAAVKIEAGISLELWKNKLKAALYGGGIPRLTFQAPANPSYLKEMGMKLYFGLKVVIWKFETRFQRSLYCWYPPGSCKSALAQAMAGSGLSNWRLAPRDYITVDYATFTANSAAPRLRRQMLRPQTTEETEIVHNVSPLAEPDLDVRDNGQQMLVWVHDDPAKPNGQGEEIYFTFWNGTNWTVAAGITNDHKEDFAPQVAFAGNGHAVAIWERSNVVQPITPTLNITFTQSLEIATSEWDGVSWSEPALLTSNHAMDYAPQLARGQDGKVMAIWFSNSGQTLVGDDDNPDSLYYAIWDESGWSAPATAVATVTGTLDASLAYFGPQAVIVLSRDTDGDPATDGDSELFYTEWNGATWSELIRLTDDEVNDLAPQVVYDGAGQANVVWLKDDRLTYLAGGWLGTPAPLWPDGDALLASYRLTVDADGNLALVYQAQSAEGGANIYYTIYDEVNGLWGLADRLTDDEPVEDYLSPTFASDGTLWIAYTKVETLFETVEVEIEGETITVEGVPVPGRSDLYLLRHTIDQDLAISADDIALSAPNPAPGQTVVISATVHSTGDLAVAGGKARFYDGNPDAGGSLIGDTQFLASPLRAGITDTVSVTWTAPITPTAHDIFVVVDPLQELEERDEGNNVAHITTILPDLLVGDLYVDYVTPQTIQITTTVANSGTVPAADVRVEWRRDVITGTLLAAATVGEILAGDSQEVGMSWVVSVADTGEHLVYAVVDPQDTITENDETNNTDLAAADVLPDLTVDGSYLKLAYDASPPATPAPVSVTLRNEGVADAYNVRLRIVQGDPFTTTSPALYETVVPALAAGGEVVLSTHLSLTAWGDVYAIADPDWEIEEIYKGDNLALLVDFPLRMYLPLLQR